MGGGWFKFYRELVDKPIWTTSTPEQKTILVTLLSMVNFKEHEWEFKGQRYKVQPGQCITSLPSIVEKSGKGITIQNVRTALKRFEKYEFLTDESTKQNRLITIVNWGIYQSDEEAANSVPNSHLTDDQQTPNSHLTANKKDNKANKAKKDKEIPPIIPLVTYAEYVSMTEKEHNELVLKFGVSGTADFIERLNLYKGSTGKKYKSDYLTILNWDRKDKAKGVKPSGKRKEIDKQYQDEIPF